MKEQGKLKINLLVDSSGGSNMLSITFKKLSGMSILVDNVPHTIEVSFVEVPLGQKKLEEFMVKDHDFLVTHWLLENSAMEIDWICEKNSCKFINFMDDFINENAYLYHPQYKDRRGKDGKIIKGSEICAHIKQRTILQAAISQLLIATTQTIVNQLLPYSDAIHLSPNYLPYGEGQYEIVDNNLSEDGLISILCVGSSSHFNDYYEIKNIIKKISDDSEIHKKAKWTIAGVIKGDKQWEKFVNLFSTNPKMKVEVIEAAPIDSYMQVYRGNVIFQPLQKNFFNEAKSSLRLAEASCRNIAVIGSDLYSNKELTGYLKCSSPKDFYSWVKYIVHNENYKELGQKLSEINRKESNFPLKIERLRKAIEIIANKQEEKPKNLKIWGITYKEDQFTEYTKILNQNKERGWRFEYQAFINKLEEIKSLGEDEYIGFFSHKFPLKTGLSSKLVYKLFEENAVNKPDIISFAPKYWKNTKEFLNFSNHYHPKLRELLEKLCNHLGLKYTEEGDFITYSNFFLMKKNDWIDYLENYVIKGLEFMEGEAWNEYNQDANYISGLSPDELEKHTGVRYYNYVTFCLERLPLIYQINKNLTYKMI